MSTVSTAGTVGTTGTLGTVSTVGTMGTVALVPEPGLQFWAARPVLRSPGRGAAGPRPPLLCSP